LIRCQKQDVIENNLDMCKSRRLAVHIFQQCYSLYCMMLVTFYTYTVALL